VSQDGPRIVRSDSLRVCQRPEQPGARL